LKVCKTFCCRGMRNKNVLIIKWKKVNGKIGLEYMLI